MTAQTISSDNKQSGTPASSTDQFFWACTKCQSSFTTFYSTRPTYCSNCMHNTLSPVDNPPSELSAIMPELITTHKINQTQISQAVQLFTQGIPYPPTDLHAGTIIKRLVLVYLPTYLVDTTIKAQWNAEFGYNYEVVSHHDHYDQNVSRWQSQEVMETRIRWEPRWGTLERSYKNIPAPALEEEKEVQNKIGDFTPNLMQPYQESLLDPGGIVNNPTRPIDDAWTDASLEAYRWAAEECRVAGKADHIRGYKWTADFIDKHWTLLLRPVYTSYYLDDEQKPQKVWIHGTTGRLTGERRSSTKRAQAAALNILTVAAVIFFIGLLITAVGFVIPPVAILGGLVLIIAIFTGLGALIPLVRSWQFNQNQ
jgi:hypothetical protein